MTIFSIGIGIGTIALYANNDGFKTFLNGMVDKYDENEHTSEYIHAEVPLSDYAPDYHENQIEYNDIASSYTDEELGEKCYFVEYDALRNRL